MDEKEYKALIFINGMDKFYNTMNSLCVEANSKFGSSNFRFLNGISLILSNRIQEGIRELNSLTNDSEVGVACILALIYSHKKSVHVDKEVVSQLEQKIKEERKRLSANSAYYCSLFLFLTGKHDKAKDYADKTLKMHHDHIDSMILKGFCLLQLNLSSKSTLEIFERAANINDSSIDANLGQVRYHQQNNDFEKAISILNRLSVRYPQLNLPLVEKMKNYLASWDYEQSFEMSYRILNMEPQNIEALRIKTVVLLCRDGKIEESAECLNALYKALEKLEPSNSEIFYEIAMLFSRCSGRNAKILAETYKFAEKSNILAPANSSYLTELGFQCVLLKQYKNATKFFRNATKIDDNSINALCGLTMCQLFESGFSTQVSQQIEFLSEIQGSINKSPLLLFLSAKISNDKPKHAISLLIEASEVHFRNLKTLSFGCEYLRVFDPDFLLQLCKELLQYCPIQQSITMKSSMPRENLHVSLKNSMNILEAIVKSTPGSSEALYLLSRVQFLSGEVGQSALSLQKILQEIDPTFTPAHLLIAQIHIQQNNHQRASQSLEICLSHDFKIRDNPLYHLISGIVQKSQQKYEDCSKSFKMALTLCGYYNVANSDDDKSSKTNGDKNLLGIADLVTLFLEMISTYSSMNESQEATKLMQFAMKEFENTSEVGRIQISYADLYLLQGNISKSLDLLSSIKPGQSYYLQAKTKMANIYLVNKKDRLSFAQCFKELVQNNPGADSWCMLADAYMSIQEPDEAVEAYRQALMQDPHDSSLASKLGRSYVKTHQYKRAIEYYKESIIAPENYQLKLDLAELYLKLKQYSNAEQIILEDIESNQKHDDDDLSKLQSRTKLLLLLSRVREKSGNINSSLSTLKEARDNQFRIQQRLSLDQNANVREQHKILSKICGLMAEQSIMIRDNDQAILHYKEAIRYSPQDTIQQAALAKLFMQLNRMQECQSICAMILDTDPNNEIAQVMMADLAFRKIDFDSAAYHFSQLILNKPTYWTALARLIEVMRRSGCLSDTQNFMERAEDAADNKMSAGLNYCKGLYDWYSCNPNNALRCFNDCRRDSEWGKQAIFNMIEICLNPDNELPSEMEISEIPDDVDVSNSRQIALKTAEKLLKELKPKTHNSLDNEALNHKLLENFLLLATRQKTNIEKALNNLSNIATQDEFKDNIGVIYGMAACYVLLKQGQRAKNQLKRVSKNLWTFEDAEYLERSWLLLSDIYIQANKYDIASDLLQKVLKHNKSCSKAYELCGSIAEKEQSFKSAALHYEQAWKFSGKQRPSIAHKLAYNSMKSKKYADAIDVCQQVLKTFPDYPSVKDIFEKCRNNLKI